jgi:hypothetical protein
MSHLLPYCNIHDRPTENQPMTDTATDRQEQLIELLIPTSRGSVRAPSDAASMLVECLAAVPDDVARSVQQAGEIWCGVWRFAATASMREDEDADEDIALETVDDVVSLSAFDMSYFSSSPPSGHGHGAYADASSWSAMSESAAGAMADPDDIAYAVDHAIAMLSFSGMIVPPDESWQVDVMREGALRDIVDRLRLNAEAEAAIGAEVVTEVSDFRNVAVEHLVRTHGRRNADIDAVRIEDIATCLSIDLSIPTSGISLMAEIHAVSDPSSWNEIVRRGIDKDTVLQAAWLFLAIDAPNMDGVDVSSPIGAVMTAAAFTTACSALLRSDPMEVPSYHPSSTMIAGRWGAAAPKVASRPGTARDNLRALVRMHVAWDALVNDARELSDLPYVVEAALETICLDAEGRADATPDWMNYGIPLVVRRYASEVHNKTDLAWDDVVQETGLVGRMARSVDPVSYEAIEDLVTHGRPVHAGFVVLDRAIVHCVDPMQDARTAERIRTVLPLSKGIAPGRAAYERVVDLSSMKSKVDDAVSLADSLMTACDVHGCWVVGTMDGRPFVAMAGHGDGNDAFVARDVATRH